MIVRVPRSNEFHNGREPSPWEATVINPSDNEQTSPDSSWRFFSQERLAVDQPELLTQWEENVKSTPLVPENGGNNQAVAVKAGSISTMTTVEKAEKQIETITSTDFIGSKTITKDSSTKEEPNSRRHRNRREKKRYEDMSLPRKIAHTISIGTALSIMGLPCTGSATPPDEYESPSLQYADPYATGCAPGTTIGGFNIAGIGNNKISLHSVRQEEAMLHEEEKDICFAALIFGDGYDRAGNASVFHDYVEKNKLDKVIIFAFSFGGMAAIDMLNEYNRQYPNSAIQIALVYISSPGEFDDLQPEQQDMVKVLSLAPLDKTGIRWLTYFSIVGQGDKNPLSEQVTEDTTVASGDTPPRLLWEQSLRILLGISKSDMNVTTSIIYDPNDKVVNMPRAINSIVERTGLAFFQIVPMTHTDHRMENHAAVWWPANNNDYKEPLLRVIEANKREFDRKAIMSILTQCVVQSRTVPHLNC